MCCLSSTKQPQSWCICTRTSSANHCWDQWWNEVTSSLTLVSDAAIQHHECGRTNRYSNTFLLSVFRDINNKAGGFIVWSLLMQPHWHIAFINQCFKGSSCFGLAFSSFYVTKDKTLEGNISIYSVVLRLRDFAVPQGGYCLQTALKCFRQYFYPKEFKEECFWFAALKTCFERRMLKCDGPSK